VGGYFLSICREVEEPAQSHGEIECVRLGVGCDLSGEPAVRWRNRDLALQAACHEYAPVCQTFDRIHPRYRARREEA
jgi:hypothetical protein